MRNEFLPAGWLDQEITILRTDTHYTSGKLWLSNAQGVSVVGDRMMYVPGEYYHCQTFIPWTRIESITMQKVD